jgi:hypothetical protein
MDWFVEWLEGVNCLLQWLIEGSEGCECLSLSRCPLFGLNLRCFAQSARHCLCLMTDAVCLYIHNKVLLANCVSRQASCVTFVLHACS